MLVNHTRRLLNKAAESGDCRISIQRKPNASWPADHSRLTALESVGHLEWVGHGDECAIWQITSAGLTQLHTFAAGGV